MPTTQSRPPKGITNCREWFPKGLSLHYHPKGIPLRTVGPYSLENW